MASRVQGITRSFRSSFTLPNLESLRWFPGHMHKGLDHMQSRLKDIDCIIEVHDARIPFSGRDTHFRTLIQLRPHILLLNKCDLVDKEKLQTMKIVDKLKLQGVDTVYITDMRHYEKSQIIRSEILPVIRELTDSKPRYNREGLKEYNAMVIGVPNVGKSTFINTVRWAHSSKKGRATVVGAKAGVTRSVLSKIKVANNPPVYIVDTPGILTPKVTDVERGMRLALCSCVPDHLVGEENIVDYMLFWFNKRGNFSYVDFFGIDEPSDSALIFLSKVALKNSKMIPVLDIQTNQYTVKPDILFAAKLVLKAFRNGKLGHILLDDDY